VLIYFHIVVKKQVTICHSAIEACKNAEAVVIATEWKEFLEIEWEEVYKGMNKPAFVFDGRLLVDAEKLMKIGFKVRFILAFCWFLSGGLNADVLGHYYWPPFCCCLDDWTGIGRK